MCSHSVFTQDVDSVHPLAKSKSNHFTAKEPKTNEYNKTRGE